MARFFRHGTVIGVDINPSTKQLAEARISIEIADQSKAQDLARLAQLGPFDLILDDGSHIWAHQILTFEYLFEALAPGGLYVLEDLDTSYGKYIADYRGDGGPSAAQYLQQLSDWVVGCRVLDPTTQPKNRVARYGPWSSLSPFPGALPSSSVDTPSLAFGSSGIPRILSRLRGVIGACS